MPLPVNHCCWLSYSYCICCPSLSCYLRGFSDHQLKHHFPSLSTAQVVHGNNNNCTLQRHTSAAFPIADFLAILQRREGYIALLGIHLSIRPSVCPICGVATSLSVWCQVTASILFPGCPCDNSMQRATYHNGPGGRLQTSLHYHETTTQTAGVMCQDIYVP